MVFETVNEARTSTDPAKLYRAMLSCSTNARREVSLGFSRGAHLEAMCSAHYAHRFLSILETLPTMTLNDKTDTAVASTILTQLGGQRFVVMTGAKFLLAHPNALSFQLPSNFARNGINRVRVELNGQDLYDVTFSRCRGLKVFFQTRVEGIDCEQLRPAFIESTGLQLSL
jgi:hypothetical protein